MQQQPIKIASKANANAIIRVLPGHFATSHSHINNYVDMTIMKSRKSEAEAAASVLAQRYSSSNYIDTIICMDGCEVIGAYLAEILTQVGVLSINAHRTIYIVSPEMREGSQMIFRDNMQMMVKDKHCLLLMANATTGKTLLGALACVQYYGGIVEGVASIFSAVHKVDGIPVNSIFDLHDLPNYASYDAHECPMCKAGQKIDGIVSSYGYSKL